MTALKERALSDDELAFYRALLDVTRLFLLRREPENSVSRPERDSHAVSRYLVSARFLREAKAHLTDLPDEKLVYVTGPQDVSTFALSRLVFFKLAHASRAYAIPDPSSQIDALEHLTEEGQALLATFHSHPGHGPDATRPSGIDLATQEQLEDLGYPTVGVIFSRDGFVRFYTKNHEFDVSVSGSGAIEVTKHLYRLIERVPTPTRSGGLHVTSC